MRRKLVFAASLMIIVVGMLGVASDLHVGYASPYIDVDVDTAYSMITNGSYPDLVVLDVRTQSEYDSGHIYSAVWIPHTELEARISELAGHEDHEIIVYCLSGGRSVTASGILDSHDFTKVYNMLGGISAWQSEGYPVWNATVHNVNTTFDYDTIQEAIDAPQTMNGHTIFVDEGTYYENVYVNKTVTLIGENRETAIINGSRVGNTLYVVANNVTVSNFTITGSELGFQTTYGIYVNSSNNAFFNNIIAENNWGIGFDEAHNNTVSSNLITSNMVGHYIEHSDNNLFKRNVLTNNSIGFYSIDSDCNVFDENIAETEGEAILVLDAHLCTFKRNTLIDNTIGFWLEKVSDSLFLENSIVNNRHVGIRYYGYSYDNVIMRNNITGNKEGLFFHDTSRTTILYNVISKNEKGIAIYGGSSIAVRLKIKYNNIINNTIGLWQSEYRQSNCAQVSQNNFIDNDVQAKNEMESILQWNTEYPSGGNYWSGYNGTDLHSGSFQNETGSDGIGDTSYVIDGKNQDNYPLMGMFNSFNTSMGYSVDIISNSTIEDFECFESNSTIKMHLSNRTANQTFGFCRVCIPHTLMNETYQVIVDGAEPYYVNYTLHDDGDNRWIYFSYQHSTLEIVIIPEFPSLVILPLFLIAKLLAIIIYRRKRFCRYKKTGDSL